MATLAHISVMLPEDLLDRARKERSSIDQLLSIALERELSRRESFNAWLDKSQAWGRSMGIRSEEDVERVANGEITLEDLKRRP